MYLIIIWNFILVHYQKKNVFSDKVAYGKVLTFPEGSNNYIKNINMVIESLKSDFETFSVM